MPKACSGNPAQDERTMEIGVNALLFKGKVKFAFYPFQLILPKVASSPKK